MKKSGESLTSRQSKWEGNEEGTLSRNQPLRPLTHLTWSFFGWQTGQILQPRAVCIRMCPTQMCEFSNGANPTFLKKSPIEVVSDLSSLFWTLYYVISFINTILEFSELSPVKKVKNSFSRWQTAEPSWSIFGKIPTAILLLFHFSIKIVT